MKRLLPNISRPLTLLRKDTGLHTETSSSPSERDYTEAMLPVTGTSARLESFKLKLFEYTSIQNQM